MTGLQIKKLKNMFPDIWKKHIGKNDKIERCIDELISISEFVLNDDNLRASLLKIENHLVEYDTFYYPKLILKKIKKYIVEKFKYFFKW